MNELERLSENLDECKELLGWLQLSTFLRKPPVDKIYVFLVQTPKGESIYCGDLSNAADGVVADYIAPTPVLLNRKRSASAPLVPDLATKRRCVIEDPIGCKPPSAFGHCNLNPSAVKHFILLHMYDLLFALFYTATTATTTKTTTTTMSLALGSGA